MNIIIKGNDGWAIYEPFLNTYRLVRSNESQYTWQKYLDFDAPTLTRYEKHFLCTVEFLTDDEKVKLL